MTTKEEIIREVRRLEFYSKYAWPVHRMLVRKTLASRCRRCILSEKYASLVDGLCPHCLDGDEFRPTRIPDKRTGMEAQFDNLMRGLIRSENHRFHILLLFSGGKDSSYMLHRLIQTYPGLRVLALTVDNTFMSPVAMENIQEIIRKVGVDHMIVRPSAATMEKMFRYAFTHLNEKGCSGTVDQFDGDFFQTWHAIWRLRWRFHI
jgi:hypothetical protein